VRGALSVSRGGFYAWLTRPRSQRSRSDEELSAKVRASFLASDRTYGARRVWRDLLAEVVAIVEAAACHVPPVRRDEFFSDVVARLRPLDEPDYANVRAATAAALTLYAERNK
jgi:transposase InsO family protein